MKSVPRLKLVAIAMAVVVVGVVAVVATRWVIPTEKTTVTAYFANSNGIFVGDDVRILGVKVGSVDKIEPQPTAAKITFSFEAKYPVPADARAAVLSPSLVTARTIQLVPAYTGGPKMQQGAVIPEERTAVPVEWDDFRVQLEKLTDSLQPAPDGGPNSVGQLVNTAADNLRGEGANTRDTLIKLSQAISALGDNSTDIFGTVRNLQKLVSGLRSSSELLSDFNANLADISSVLSNSPNEVANAAKSLDGAVNDLRGFAADNRESLGTTFDRLASITTALNDKKQDVAQLLHAGPTIFSNFNNMYQPAQGTLSGYLAVGNFANPVQFICSAIQAASRQGAAESARLCTQYLAPIIKNRQYNFLPIGVNQLVGTAARPNELTYSENRMRPDLPPPAESVPAPGGEPAAAPPDQPLAAEAPLPDAPPPPPPVQNLTDPAKGLPGMMIPGGTP